MLLLLYVCNDPRSRTTKREQLHRHDDITRRAGLGWAGLCWAVLCCAQCIVYSPDGRHLAVAGEEKAVVVWDLKAKGGIES